MLSLKKIVTGVAGTLLLASSYASTPDVCFKLPGYWHGSSHLKNAAECELFNGCSHVFSLHVSQQSADQYRLKMTFTDGHQVRKQEVTAECHNGEIQLPLLDTQYTTSLDCDSENECFLVFDSARFNAEMIKRS